MHVTTHAQPVRPGSRQDVLRFVLCVLWASAAHSTLVTLQSQTQEEMDALTAAVSLT